LMFFAMLKSMFIQSLEKTAENLRHSGRLVACLKR
jgi:hypothetical protein